MWLNITSHRAYDKIKRQGIKTLELINWPSMNHYHVTYERHKDMIKNIKGVKILTRRPRGRFTKCWK